MNKYRVQVAKKAVGGVYAFVGAGALVLGGEEAVPPPGRCKVLEGGKMVVWGETGLALPGVTVAALDAGAAAALKGAVEARGPRVGGMAEWWVNGLPCWVFMRFWGSGLLAHQH